MQAIITKFYGPTIARPCGRVRAVCQAGHIDVDATGDGFFQECRRAAESLAEKYGWDTSGMVGGGMPDGSGFAFVFTS